MLACARKDAPSKAARSEAAQAKADPAPHSWSWHSVSNILVVEGEVDGPGELVLTGANIHQRRYVEAGPVRWEMYMPFKPTPAELRDGRGRVLAKWRIGFEEAPVQSSTQASTPITAPAPASAPPPASKKRGAPPAPVLVSASVPVPVSAPASVPTPAPNAAADAARVRIIIQLEGRSSGKPLAPMPQTPSLRWKAFSAPGQPKGGLSPVPECREVIAKAKAVARESGQPKPLNLERGPSDKKTAYLTFDGGSSAESAHEILDALKGQGIRSTFFLTGVFIERFPEVVKRIHGDGHEIGNHTYSHPHLAPRGRRDAAWTKSAFQAELRRAEQALEKLLGQGMAPWWRAPFGEHTLEIRQWAEELGYSHVGWSEGADTLDWAGPKQKKLYRSGDAILQRLEKRMKRKDGGGLIVLMHLGSTREEGDRPAESLAAFIEKRRNEGWFFTTLGNYNQMVEGVI